MAKIHYAADGDVPPERFIAALTDFSDRRSSLWPNLSPAFFKVHELGPTWADVNEGTDIAGGVWARERYEWSTPGTVRLTLVESPLFESGTVIEYRVTARPGGGCHVDVQFHRIARSLKARVVGAVLQLNGPRMFGGQLRETLARLATLDRGAASRPAA